MIDVMKLQIVPINPKINGTSKHKLKMPEFSSEYAYAKLKELKYSKNGNHQPVAAAKIMPKRVEFQEAKSKGLDPDKRIKSGSKADKSGKNLALYTKPAKGQSPKVEINVVIKPSSPGGTKVHTSISDHRITSTHFIAKRYETYQHAKSTVNSKGGSLGFAEERQYIKKIDGSFSRKAKELGAEDFDSS